MTTRDKYDAIVDLLGTWGAEQENFNGRPSDRLHPSNVFSLFGIEADELSHSAFLAWLFDPAASHSYAECFLEVFLSAAKPRISLELPGEYQVQTELSRMRSIIDIAVYKPYYFILYIENKTVSPDMDGQHDREFEDLRRMGSMLKVPKARQFPIYLTPYGRRARGENQTAWYRVAYQDIGQAFAQRMPEIRDEKTRFLLDDWLDAITSFGGMWRDKMTRLSPTSALLGANWSSVVEITAARERLDQELLALLYTMEHVLAELPWWQQGWQFRRHKTWIYIHKTRWCNAEGRALVTMGIYPFKAENVFGSGSLPHLYIWVRSGCDELRDALRTALESEGYEVLKNQRHLLYHPVMQCPPNQEAIKAYPNQVREQMAALFTEYAEFMLRHEEIIQAYVK
jgi:hypothetical protein